ncbi:MAG: hypothetical protein GX640_23480, partial [Fibrobacter sp.]|nr:hypothetical protein [Fibrobacter sp.]
MFKPFQPQSNEPRFSVVYQITTGENQSIEEITRDICIEQTVEIPFDCIPDEHISNGLIGVEESCQKIDTNTYEVTISYRYDITSFSIPQFLNIIFGNISLKTGIKVIDIQFTQALPPFLPGPAWGIEGIRKLTGVFERPLTCSALKPMGATVDTLARMAGDFAYAGIDLIKDDHGLTDQCFHRFEERVARCNEAVQNANSITGHHTLYLPNISGSLQQVESQIHFALKHGIRGVLVSPMLIGMDNIRHISTTYNLIVMAHPAFTGNFFSSTTHGITPAVLLGKIFRLIGSDISIFPNFGGRFPLSEQTCISLASALRSDLNGCKKSFPCPAGGMNLEKLPGLVKTYEKDSILLIGGALLQKSKDLKANTAEFVSTLNTFFKEQIKVPEEEFVSSCAWNGPTAKKENTGIYHFNNYSWTNRTVERYK